MSENPCKNCGREEDEHCTFEPIPARPGCVCETESWGNPSDIPAVCDNFVNDPEHLGEVYCLNCEHDEGCHSTPSPPQGG